MASKTMTKTRFPKTAKYVREFSESLSSPGNGDSVLIPRGAQSILISLKITSGEGKVQYSNSSIASVKADTAEWTDWDAGSVTSDTDDVLYPVTAIRVVNTSGTTLMYGSAK